MLEVSALWWADSLSYGSGDSCQDSFCWGRSFGAVTRSRQIQNADHLDLGFPGPGLARKVVAGLDGSECALVEGGSHKAPSHAKLSFQIPG